MSKTIPFDHHGISGGLHVTLRDGLTLDDFCMQNIPGYNSDRFEAVALRMFAGKEIIATVYVLDKHRQEGSNYDPGKLPVKKIKLENITIANLFEWFSDFNFTLSSGNYDLEDIEVINK